jgi:hypothetical protein
LLRSASSGLEPFSIFLDPKAFNLAVVAWKAGGRAGNIMVSTFLDSAVVTSIRRDQTTRRFNLMTASTRCYIVGSLAHVDAICSC